MMNQARWAVGIVLAACMAAGPAAAADKVIVTIDEAAEARAACPVLLQATLPADLLAAAKDGRLCAAELAAEGKPGPETPAQFQPASDSAVQGLLGFLPAPRPAGGKGARRFQLRATSSAADKTAALSVSHDDKQGRWTLMDNQKPVLCYHFAAVPVPAGVGGIYAVARSDYVHPMFGPGGEVLTFDYSKDHPHHRGLYWAWPETYRKGQPQPRDLHALQGLFARPVKVASTEAGPVWSAITAENRWMWADQEPIVQERATIRAFAQAGGRRCIDFEFTFTALEEGPQIATRGQKAYGGFNLRFSPRQGQKIVTVDDKPDVSPRVSAGQIVGTPPEGKTPVAVVILQNAANPCYPGAWVSYPNLNWLQPTFPTNGTKYPLDKDKPLTLRYRLVIQPGEVDQAAMREMWSAYNRPTGNANLLIGN